jgi:3',5'-cyclic-AMP phosphodiesterase
MKHEPLVIMIPGDLHLTEPGLDNHQVGRWAVEQANTLIHPDVVQFIGDNVQNGTQAQFDLFKRLAEPLQMPWYALVGDHDLDQERSDGLFRANVGAGFGTCMLKGHRLIRLHTQEAKPLGLSFEQLDWFRQQVDFGLSAGERVVVFQHNYPYQIWEDFAGPGADVWREIVQTRRITAIFSGHTHYWQIANDGRNVCVAGRSIGDPEGGPPGYTLVFLHNEDLAVCYRTIQDSEPIVLITHPRDYLLALGPAHVVSGRDCVRARIWSRRPLATVQYRLDSGPWMPLEPVGCQDWAGPLGGDKLAKGQHSVHVVAETENGTCGEQAIDFPVDATGRFTAVPGVRPLVSATAFC